MYSGETRGSSDFLSRKSATFLFTDGVREEDPGSDLQVEKGAKQTPGAPVGDLGDIHGNNDGCCAA